MDAGAGIVVRGRGQAVRGTRVRVGIRPERIVAAAGAASGGRQLGHRRGHHQDVPGRPDPDRGQAGHGSTASWCASSAPAPTPRSTPSTQATGSLSAGTKPPRCSWVNPCTPPPTASRRNHEQPTGIHSISSRPRAMKPKLDYLHREVQRAAGRRITGGRPSAWAGWRSSRAAACGKTTTTLRRHGGAARQARRQHPRRASRWRTTWRSTTGRSTTTRRRTRSSRSCRPRPRPG